MGFDASERYAISVMMDKVETSLIAMHVGPEKAPYPHRFASNGWRLARACYRAAVCTDRNSTCRATQIMRASFIRNAWRFRCYWRKVRPNGCRLQRNGRYYVPRGF